MTRTRKNAGYRSKAEERADRERKTAVAVQAAHGLLTSPEQAASGRTLSGAAPLVFQAMCRREGIRVYFTEAPMTNGRGIWLGPVDLTNPLAPVYVYGHGCHERHHVVHTDFSALKDAEEGAVREFTNVFEDIRVDRLGAQDYEGYLLWRSALMTALVNAGTAPWAQPASLPLPTLLLHTVLLTLETETLGLDVLTPYRDALRLRADDAFGADAMADVMGLIRSHLPLSNTADAVRLAVKVTSRLRRLAKKAKEALEAFGTEVDIKLMPETGDLQGSLFDGDGEVTLYADPRLQRPGFAEAHRAARCLQALGRPEGWQAADGTAGLRQLITGAAFTNADESLGADGPRFAGPDDYRCLDREASERQKAAFHALWAKSASLRRRFQASLMHPVATPVRLDVTGEDLEDDALALLTAGEDRIFRRDMPLMGRRMAVQILLDTSGSMEGPAMTRAKVAAMRLLEALRSVTGAAAALSLFPGAGYRGVTAAASFETSLREAVGYVDFVEGFGSTPILQALFAAALALDARPEPAKAVFVITDGLFSEEPVTEMIETLRARGILVAMLGIGEMCQPMGDFTARVTDTQSLPHAVAELLRQLVPALRRGEGLSPAG